MLKKVIKKIVTPIVLEDLQNKNKNFTLSVEYNDTISFNAKKASEVMSKVHLKSQSLSENEHYYCVLVMYKVTS